jgi:hypothetical protein
MRIATLTIRFVLIIVIKTIIMYMDGVVFLIRIVNRKKKPTNTSFLLMCRY